MLVTQIEKMKASISSPSIWLKKISDSFSRQLLFWFKINYAVTKVMSESRRPKDIFSRGPHSSNRREDDT